MWRKSIFSTFGAKIGSAGTKNALLHIDNHELLYTLVTDKKKLEQNKGIEVVVINLNYIDTNDSSSIVKNDFRRFVC